MPVYQLLTDRTLAQASAITPTTLIHIVYTGDPSQNIAGSSYKAELQQLSSIFSGNTDTLVTGGTYSAGTITFTNSSGGTFDVLGLTDGSYYLPLSGGTVTGNTIFTQGISALTISATTYLNLPITTDVFVTGGTYSNGDTTFTNNTGGTFNVTGFYTGSTDIFVTGGTYSNGDTTFTNNTGGTFNVTGFYTGSTDVFVTGGTYSAGTITFTNITGGTFNVTGLTTGSTSTVSGDYLPLSGGTVTGDTVFTQGLTATTISATTYLNLPLGIYGTGLTYNVGTFNLDLDGPNGVLDTVNLSSLASDLVVTGGTYDMMTGNATFTNATGGTFVVTGFLVGYTDLYVTGGTYSAGTITFTNTSGGTFNVTGLTTGSTSTVSGDYLPLSGGTVTGNTVFTQGLTATTISATTYQNLPIDLYVTGGTYSAGTITFTNTSGGTFNVTGLTTGSTITIGGEYLPISGGTVTGNTVFTQGLTATTISATTYQNLPTDIRITGATYSNNTFTHRNNTGGTYTVLFNTVTGLTSTGTISSNTISATTYQNLPTDIRITGATYSNNTFTHRNNTGGTYTVLFNTVTGLTVNGQLSVTGNTGLGTSSPSTKLDISSSNTSVALGNTLRFTDTDTAAQSNQFIGKIEFYGSDSDGAGVKGYVGVVQSTTAQGSIIFGTTGTTGSLTGATTVGERMRIDNSGNVGIGTSSPTYTLEVSSGAETVDEVVTHFRNNSSKGILFIPVANTGSYNFNTISGDTVLVSTTGQPFVIGSKDGAAFRFSGAAAAISASTITTGGKLGIGAVFYSSAEQPSESLDVNGNGRFRAITAGASAGALHYTSNGTLTTNTSDIRLKENIKPLTKALEKVLQLNGISYNWIGQENNRIGFIAQEVEKVLPELVFTNNNTEEKYKGIHQDNLTAILTEAIKEQQKIIEELKIEIKNLKIRIDNL